MDEEDEFSKTSISNDDDEKYKYFLVRPIAETHSPLLRHAAMMSKQLMGKRPSTTILSKEEHKPLREFIEQHFDDATPAEGPVVSAPQKKANSKKQEKPKVKTDRRPPFKFSMIGLKPGDSVTFESTGVVVKVASDKTIKYNEEEYTLNRFVTTFLPDEKKIPAGTYQGPKFFTYKNKTLWALRLEKENNK